MELNSFRTLGRSGLRVSPITLRGLAFGDVDRGDNDQTSTALLDRYLAAGGNVMDTANVYNEGRSEETIGASLDKHRGLRDRLVIATRFTGGMFPRRPGRRRCRPQGDHAGRGLSAPPGHRPGDERPAETPPGATSRP
jgi:aryl-alcohol dehydrogenase-like predicted oxidoreductase